MEEKGKVVLGTGGRSLETLIVSALEDQLAVLQDKQSNNQTRESVNGDLEIHALHREKDVWTQTETMGRWSFTIEDETATSGDSKLSALAEDFCRCFRLSVDVLWRALSSPTMTEHDREESAFGVVPWGGCSPFIFPFFHSPSTTSRLDRS